MGIMDEYDSLAPVSLYHPHLTEYFDSGLTSTMIDDVFYVLKKCSLRSFATVNASAVCATVNHVNSTLARDLKDAMEAELKHYNNLYVHNQQSYMSSGKRQITRSTSLSMILFLCQAARIISGTRPNTCPHTQSHTHIHA